MSWILLSQPILSNQLSNMEVGFTACWVMSQTDEMWVIVPTGLIAPRSVQQCVVSAMAHLILTADPGESRKRVSLELQFVKRESKLIHMYISCQLVCSPQKSVGKRQYF